MGFFQRTKDIAQSVPNVKYASDYDDLNMAFSDLQEGDILFVNKPSTGDWYTLTSTAEITQRNVQIIGMGGRIRPSSNGSPSPLIRIKNISTGNNRRKLLTNILISGLQLENGATIGSGTGYGIEILNDPSVKEGLVWHVKFDDLYIENFEHGIRIVGAFDVTLDNCSISECLIGLRLEVNDPNRVVGQIRLFGGFFVRNSYHIALDKSENGPSDVFFGQLQLFGSTFGHQRTDGTLGPDAVIVNKWTQAILAFGCHFEELAHGIHFASGVPSSPPFSSLSQMSISVIGSTFHLMTVPGAGIDTNGTNAELASLVSLGNNYGPNDNTSQFYNAPRFSQGVLIAGNTQNLTYSQNYPTAGLIQHTPASNKGAYRVSPFSTSARPAANAVPIGTVIFNTTTNKLDVSDGTNWRDANGTIV